MTNPDEYWLEKADQLKKQGKFEESIKCMDRAFEIKGERSKDYWYKKALALLEIKKYEEALEYLDKDLENKKPNFESYFEKGSIFFHLEKYSQAVEFFNKAWEIKYEEFLKFQKKGEALKNYKKFEKAVISLDIANTMEKIPEKFWYYKGLSEFKIGKYYDGINSFEEGLKQKPNDTQILYNKAKCLSKMGKTEECMEILSKTCRLEPDLIKKIQKDEDLNDEVKNRFLNNVSLK